MTWITILKLIPIVSIGVVLFNFIFLRKSNRSFWVKLIVASYLTALIIASANGLVLIFHDLNPPFKITCEIKNGIFAFSNDIPSSLFFIDSLSLTSFFVLCIALLLNVLANESTDQSFHAFLRLSPLAILAIALFTLGDGYVLHLTGSMILTLLWIVITFTHSFRQETEPRYMTLILMPVIADILLFFASASVYCRFTAFRYQDVLPFIKMDGAGGVQVLDLILAGSLILSACIKMALFPFINWLPESIRSSLTSRLILYTLLMPASGYILLRNYPILKTFSEVIIALALLTMLLAVALMHSTHRIKDSIPFFVMVLNGYFTFHLFAHSYSSGFVVFIFGSIASAILTFSAGLVLTFKEKLQLGEFQEFEWNIDDWFNPGRFSRLGGTFWFLWLTFILLSILPPVHTFHAFDLIAIALFFYAILRFYYVLSCNYPDNAEAGKVFSKTKSIVFSMLVIAMLGFAGLIYAIMTGSQYRLSNWSYIPFSSERDFSADSHFFLYRAAGFAIAVIVLMGILQRISTIKTNNQIKVGFLRWIFLKFLFVNEANGKLADLFLTTGNFIWRIDSWMRNAFVTSIRISSLQIGEILSKLNIMFDTDFFKNRLESSRKTGFLLVEKLESEHFLFYMAVFLILLTLALWFILG